MPKHKNPCPGGYEIYNLRRPFLGHQKYILHLSEPCPGVEEKIFKEIMHFHNMTYDIYGHARAQEPLHRFYIFLTTKLPPLRVGIMKFTTSCHLTVQMLHTKFGTM